MLLSLVLTSAVACDKKDKKDPDTAGAAPAAAKAADAPSSVTLDLAAYGLQITAAPGSTAGEGPFGDGAQVRGPAGIVDVIKAAPEKGVSLAKALEDLSIYTPLNIKSEELADGWIVSFENKGSAGTNYWVNSVRKISGNVYTCGTTAHTADQQKSAADACKSLTKK